MGVDFLEVVVDVGEGDVDGCVFEDVFKVLFVLV